MEYLLDVGTVRDKHDKPHLFTVYGAQQRQHLVNPGYQHRPQVMRCCTLGLNWFGRGCDIVTRRHQRGNANDQIQWHKAWLVYFWVAQQPLQGDAVICLCADAAINNPLDYN